MTSTNRDVAHDINHGIGFNIACVFYFATADGKESGSQREGTITPRRTRSCSCSSTGYSSPQLSKHPRSKASDGTSRACGTDEKLVRSRGPHRTLYTTRYISHLDIYWSFFFLSR